MELVGRNQHNRPVAGRRIRSLPPRSAEPRVQNVAFFIVKPLWQAGSLEGGDSVSLLGPFRVASDVSLPIRGNEISWLLEAVRSSA